VADAEQRTAAQFIAQPEGSAGIPQSTVDELRRAPGVTALTAVVPTTVFAVGSDVAVSVGAGGVDPAELTKSFRLTTAAGSLGDFRGDAVVLTAETADMVDWKAGDQVDVILGDGTRKSVKVAAVLASGGSLPGMLLSRDLVLGHVHARMSDAVYVSSGDPVAAAGVQVVPINDWLTAQAEAAGRANRVVFLLLIGMAMLYSGLAIANTLLMAAGLRVRDVALLRLVGATGQQVLRMFMWETLMTITVGVVLGTFAAVVSIAGVVSALSTTNPAAVLSVPLLEVLLVVAGCVAIALAASLIPARLALRARPLDSATMRE
jgi:putative ABC transport system permease protein